MKELYCPECGEEMGIDTVVEMDENARAVMATYRYCETCEQHYNVTYDD